jgi:RNA polymerase sigma-70 factor (ECF subfamily)
MSEYGAFAFGLVNTIPPDKIVSSSDGVHSMERQNRTRSLEFFSFDQQYLNRLVAGDPGTECHFVEYFSFLLRAKLQVRLRSAQDAEDLTQEVFLRVLQSLRKGRGVQHPGKLGAFVNAVCNNVVFEHIRGKGRTRQWDDSTPEPRDNSIRVERELMSQEIRQQVRTVLEELPAKDRGLLRAIFLEEQDKDTVCHDYGVQREYLRVLLHRARRRMRQLLVGPKITNDIAARTSWSAHQ